MDTKREYCFLHFCQNYVAISPNGRMAKSCCIEHSKLSTTCWMNGCDKPRFQYDNGKKAPGCCINHTIKVNQILKGEKNCDGSDPSTCVKCRPDDFRDVAHSSLITGNDCYCYSCICKK
tara:strand:+ start:125 stop:481 length:357 start_codon:yes stop_codon:yes gene_type:complete